MADLLSMKIPCGQIHVICFTFEFQWPEKVYCINSLVFISRHALENCSNRFYVSSRFSNRLFNSFFFCNITCISFYPMITGIKRLNSSDTLLIRENYQQRNNIGQ